MVPGAARTCGPCMREAAPPGRRVGHDLCREAVRVTRLRHGGGVSGTRSRCTVLAILLPADQGCSPRPRHRGPGAGRPSHPAAPRRERRGATVDATPMASATVRPMADPASRSASPGERATRQTTDELPLQGHIYDHDGHHRQRQGGEQVRPLGAVLEHEGS